VSAAELPAMSRARGEAREIATYLQQRLNAGLRRVAFFIVPSVIGFLALGDVIAAAIYQSGRFTAADAIYVWGILAGAAVGLLASTGGRLYASAYYAMRDTRTPLNYAVIRIVVATGLGYLCAVPLPPVLGIEARWGVAGLTLGSSVAAWVEFALLRRSLNRRIGRTDVPLALLAQLSSAALTGALAAWAVKLALGPQHPLLAVALILSPYGIMYVGLTYGWGVPEAKAVVGRVARLLS
jgi:putative peptidoglycan lipid II flippase